MRTTTSKAEARQRGIDVATLTLEQLTASQNVTELLTEEEVRGIGVRCLEDYDSDKASRSEWEERNAEALKLALQVREEKAYPWQGAASVKFPLLSTAALQYLCLSKDLPGILKCLLSFFNFVTISKKI